MTVPIDHPLTFNFDSGLNYRSAKRAMTRRFAEAGLPFADEDALDLLLGLVGLTQTDYILRGADPLGDAELAALQAATERRLKGEPVDRILGWRDFYGRRFAIDNVLSPRGDTEVLLLAALGAIRDISAPRLLDLGTGSGALAISILCERPDATLMATDREPAALLTAARNAASHGVSDRLTLIQSDWFAEIPPSRFDAVLSNPPYISTAAMAGLAREVAAHDPETALHGGPDGLAPYRIIIPSAADALVPGGWLGVEIGFDQGQAVAALFSEAGFERVCVCPDPAGQDRIVHGWRGDMARHSSQSSTRAEKGL
ncbi:peptide chain release factor N(5)-glutamine methyltransferase [Algimonas porphyrae]|uniref:Release factor glutamine methyltransferase n=1 Tax=Algimonas porphyrae TaxID=1128113 RepID=A0ABQ5V3A7_9PROT|nr:peptide chain release factor N(5)-glutamine methyltransferase [Algimonas porphyrae]GLQ21537.1 release factor glutamine methyltransferase [Algimonas porphyrae]